MVPVKRKAISQLLIGVQAPVHSCVGQQEGLHFAGRPAHFSMAYEEPDILLVAPNI